MKKQIAGLLFIAVCLQATQPLRAQKKSRLIGNVQICATDSEADVIRKAAQLTPSARQFRWQQLELTAFFHFGVNTFTDREWGDGKEDPRIFNPSALDARQWVRTAKDAGIKQVIITAKHHDGFCLWPTKTTAHSVKSSPWKNGAGDVVKEVADACKEYGIGFGVYVSPWDRNSPVYGTPEYNDLFVTQLTELLTGYGDVDEVWFDGANGEGPNGKKQVYDFPRWYKLIRNLQPKAVIAIMGPDVRWVGTESGKGRETEWSVLPIDAAIQESIAAESQQNMVFVPLGDKTGEDLGSRDKIRNAKGLIWYPAETDVSIRPGWFFHEKENTKVKSPERLMEIYYTSVGMNSVLLLNIPPDKRGLIHEADVNALQGWQALKSKTFSVNFAKGAAITYKGKKTTAGKTGNAAMLDGRYATHWTTPDGDTTASLLITLKNTSEFDVLELQEDILKGQRIEKFTVEYLNNGRFEKLTEGTTVGYKRTLRFPLVKTNQIRINILSSRLQPTIAELGLYKQAKR